VPIKNGLISDVFSQIFLWKELIINSLINLKWPLWNPYSYSGYPLMANFQSGVLNPLNIFMLLLGKTRGWSAMIISQTLLSFVFMFFFLRKINKTRLASIAGSITYGLGGFAICWSQFTTASSAMIWLPLLLLTIKVYFTNRKIVSLAPISPLILLLTSSGHFQSLVYGLLFFGGYFIWNNYHYEKKIFNRNLFYFLMFFMVGVALSSIQLLPTLELAKYSIRFSEKYIANYNFGLIPIKNLVTLFSPDYFGNPATRNYWGSFNYLETIIYTGILGLLALISAIHNFKNLKDEKYFLIIGLISLLLALDTSPSRLIYQFNLPGLSTGSAGRIIILFSFCASVLVAWFLDSIARINLKKFIHYYWGLFLFLTFVGLFNIFMMLFFRSNPNISSIENNWVNISIRNMFFPSIIIGSMSAIIISPIKNANFKKILLIFILILDLYRFGWKYTPFVKKEIVFPNTEITNFLQQQEGVFRVEKEKGPLLSPNTWTHYGLMSPSGYDPLAIKHYVNFFEKELNMTNKNESSRYSEIKNYDPKQLGKFNVRYLLALKYDDTDKITPKGNKLNYKIKKSAWNKVFQKGSVVILENPDFQPRITFKNREDGKVDIIDYQPGKIVVNYLANKPTEMFLKETWMPGWKARFHNNNNNKVLDTTRNNAFQKIPIDKGEDTVTFYYKPNSFIYGRMITLASGGIWIAIVVCLTLKRKKTERLKFPATPDSQS